jgi:hypothetical protein
LLSTVNRQSRMIVVVHSVSWLAFASQHELPSSRPNGQQPLETSHLELNLALHIWSTMTSFWIVALCLPLS